MKRRSFIVGALGGLVPTFSRSATICGITQSGPICRVYIQSPNIVKQQCPEWCWAASASMIFSMHNHPVAQEKIVARVFGGLACGSTASITIGSVLSSGWIDDYGRPFQARVSSAYDVVNGINAISNQFILNQLLSNRPLLYCNSHHAMVLAQVEYINFPGNQRILSMGVFDPFPGAPSFHNLTASEATATEEGGDMTFLAAVDTT